jgi:hypothetical protein
MEMEQVIRDNPKTLKCDKCGKIFEGEALTICLPDFAPESQHNLGKYWGTKTNVNGILTWHFCIECVLDKLLDYHVVALS